jgi:integrase
VKANADLEIPMHPELSEILEARLKEVEKCSPDDFVLGEEIKKFRNSFKEALRRAGLPHMRFHDLRHTVSTWLAVRYPQAIKDAMLGHAPRGVSGLYTHVQFEDLKKAIEAMPRLLPNVAAGTAQALGNVPPTAAGK